MHAQLAWKVVAWLLQVGGASVRGAVTRAFDDAMLRPRSERNALRDDAPYGALDNELADDIRIQAQDKIISPAARSLGIEVVALNLAA
jgi:hypothetical protein